ncbi:MAG: TonB-dependent receptor plug domain-containing protein [Bacteroidota bacterium]
MSWRLLSLTLFLLIFSLKTKGQGEVRVIDESFHKQPLSLVLDLLKEKYGQEFNFDASSLSKVKVTCELHGHSFEEVLPVLLENTSLTFRKVGEFYLINPIKRKQIRVRGIVRDASTRFPLGYATIRAQGQEEIGVYADSTGQFLLELTEGEVDTLLVSHVGYFVQKVPFTTSMGRKYLTLRIHRDESLLPTVEIADNHFHGPQTIKISDAPGEVSIDPAKSSLISGFGEPDLFRALQMIPGVSSADESASNLNVRGGQPSQNLILLDGITLYQPSHFFGLLGTVNTHAIKDVSLFRGGYDARYGGRTAGVIDITGRPGQTTEDSYGSSMNFLNLNGYLEVPLKKEKLSVMVAGRSSYSNPDQLEIGPYQNLILQRVQESYLYSREEVDPLYRFRDFNTKLVWLASDEDLFSASVYGSYDQLKYNIPQFNKEQQVDMITKGVSLGWNRQWNKRWYSKTNLTYSGYQQQFRSDAESSDLQISTDQYNVIHDLAIRHDHEWEVNRRDKFEAGVFFSQLSTSFLDRYTVDTLTFRDNNSAQAGGLVGAYTQYTILPDNGKWDVKLGLRYNYYSPKNKSYLEPRLNLNYHYNKNLSFKASVGRYNQFIQQLATVNESSLAQSYWALAGQDSLLVANANHFILGGTYQKGRWTIDLELYNYIYGNIRTDSLLFDYGNNRYIPDTSAFLGDGRADAMGLDLMIKYESSHYSSWVSYSLSSVQYNFPGFSEGTDFAASFDRRHLIRWVHMISWRRWQGSTSLIWGTGLPFTDILDTDNPDIKGNLRRIEAVGAVNGERLPSYQRMDLTLAYKVIYRGSWVSQIGLSAFNVLNTQNAKDVVPLETGGPEAELKFRNLLGFTPNIFINLKF